MDFLGFLFFLLLVQVSANGISLRGIARDFKQSHPDFQKAGACCNVETGIVKEFLGDDGKPIFDGASSVTNETTFNQWFRDVPGTNQRLELLLHLEETESGSLKFNPSSHFFPLDNKGFGNEGLNHNFYFTVELHTFFEYKGGEVLDLSGEDDIWIFINDELVVDLGGVHPSRSASVHVDNLGLEIGKYYKFDLFFAERFTVNSVLTFETTIRFEENLNDYVVVGSGPGGAVVANRLSENENVNVLVLEAGSATDETNILSLPPKTLSVPFFWPTLLTTPVDWNYWTTSTPSALLRQIAWPRGKALGGSSAINAMNYVRGRPSDYDRWENVFNAQGWSFNDVLPYFKKSENQQGSANNSFHGFSGPLVVRDPPFVFDISNKWLDAALAVGFPFNPDFNGPSGQFGVGFYQKTIDTQQIPQRSSAYTAFLKSASNRPNLQVQVKSEVTKVIFDNKKRAIGVSFVRNGVCLKVFATQEVILAAGAIGSPQILMLSGVGPKSELENLGIPVIFDSTNVGNFLQDHPFLFTQWNADITPIGAILDNAIGEYFVNGTGPVSIGGGDAGAFLTSGPNVSEPDFHFIIVGFRSDNFGAGGFGAHIELLRPISSPGKITLFSSNPFDRPYMDANYFREQADIDVIVNALEILESIIAKMNQLYPGLNVARAVPPPGLPRAALEEFIRATIESGYHPCGTLRMGDSPEAPVDSNLRVKGVKRLRIVDSSVFPEVPSANTQAATYMVGEKGADLIKNDYIAQIKSFISQQSIN